MTVVQPACLDSGDEELRSIGVGTSVGHRQAAGFGVLEREVLIFELVAIDGLATGAIVIGEVAALAHEVGNHTMEGRAGKLFVCDEKFIMFRKSQLDDMKCVITH